MKSEITAILNHTQAKLDSISQELIAELTSLTQGNYGLSKKMIIKMFIRSVSNFLRMGTGW
ncbi:hypothetical protein ACFQ3S_01495 [Mucilaginibacter terrae]